GGVVLPPLQAPDGFPPDVHQARQLALFHVALHAELPDLCLEHGQPPKRSNARKSELRPSQSSTKPRARSYDAIAKSPANTVHANTTPARTYSMLQMIELACRSFLTARSSIFS